MALTQVSGSLDISPSLHGKRSAEPLSDHEFSCPNAATRRRLFENSSQCGQICSGPSGWQTTHLLQEPDHPLLNHISAVPGTQNSQSDAWGHTSLFSHSLQLWANLPVNTRHLLRDRLHTSGLQFEVTATGRHMVEIEHHAQALFGERNAREDACWLDDNAIWTMQDKQMGVAKFHAAFGDVECAQVTAS